MPGVKGKPSTRQAGFASKLRQLKGVASEKNNTISKSSQLKHEKLFINEFHSGRLAAKQKTFALT
jgi:hypothetical protein